MWPIAAGPVTHSKAGHGMADIFLWRRREEGGRTAGSCNGARQEGLEGEGTLITHWQQPQLVRTMAIPAHGRLGVGSRSTELERSCLRMPEGRNTQMVWRIIMWG